GVGVAGLGYWLQKYMLKGRDYGVVSGKPKQVKLIDHKALTIPLSIFSGFVVIVPLLAMGTVILQSFATTWGKDPLPNGYTLDHYRTIFTSSLGNIQNSLILAAGALILSVVLAIFVSYFVVRYRSTTLDFMTTIPLIVPGIAFGIALIQTFNTAPLQL